MSFMTPGQRATQEDLLLAKIKETNPEAYYELIEIRKERPSLIKHLASSALFALVGAGLGQVFADEPEIGAVTGASINLLRDIKKSKETSDKFNAVLNNLQAPRKGSALNHINRSDPMFKVSSFKDLAKPTPALSILAVSGGLGALHGSQPKEERQTWPRGLFLGSLGGAALAGMLDKVPIKNSVVPGSIVGAGLYYVGRKLTEDDEDENNN